MQYTVLLKISPETLADNKGDIKDAANSMLRYYTSGIQDHPAVFVDRTEEVTRILHKKVLGDKDKFPLLVEDEKEAGNTLTRKTTFLDLYGSPASVAWHWFGFLTNARGKHGYYVNHHGKFRTICRYGVPDQDIPTLNPNDRGAYGEVKVKDLDHRALLLLHPEEEISRFMEVYSPWCDRRRMDYHPGSAAHREYEGQDNLVWSTLTKMRVPYNQRQCLSPSQLRRDEFRWFFTWQTRAVLDPTIYSGSEWSEGSTIAFWDAPIPDHDRDVCWGNEYYNRFLKPRPNEDPETTLLLVSVST